MFEFLQTPSSIRLFGILGGLVPLAAALISGLVYRSKQGEPYSPLRFFISELGERGVSRLAPVFNVGLILCGLLLLPCCVGLGLLIPGALAKIAMLVGCLAAIAVSLVGVFPMNNLKPHTLAAMSFFRLGLAMVILFTLAIFIQPEEPPALPRALGLLGVPAIVSYAGFLIYSSMKAREVGDILDPEAHIQRPRFWPMTVWEWAIFVTTVPFFLSIALAI